MIARITAVHGRTRRHLCGNVGKRFAWSRQTIGNLVEHVPLLLQMDGFWTDVKIERLELDS